jgi:hypothetical protein
MQAIADWVPPSPPDDTQLDSPILQAGRAPPDDDVRQQVPAYPATVPGHLPAFATASPPVQFQKQLQQPLQQPHQQAQYAPMQQSVPPMQLQQHQQQQQQPHQQEPKHKAPPQQPQPVQINQPLQAIATSWRAPAPVPIQQPMSGMASAKFAPASVSTVRECQDGAVAAMQLQAPVPNDVTADDIRLARTRPTLLAMAKLNATAPPVQLQPLPDHVPPAMAKESSVQQPLPFAPFQNQPAAVPKPPKRAYEKKTKTAPTKRARAYTNHSGPQGGFLGCSADGASSVDGQLAADVPVSSLPALKGASHSTLTDDARRMLLEACDRMSMGEASVSPHPPADQGIEICVFCQHPLGNPLHIQELSCGHKFHGKCLDDYIAHAGCSKSNACPLKCWRTVKPDEQPETIAVGHPGTSSNFTISTGAVSSADEFVPLLDAPGAARTMPVLTAGEVRPDVSEADTDPTPIRAEEVENAIDSLLATDVE